MSSEFFFTQFTEEMPKFVPHLMRKIKWQVEITKSGKKHNQGIVTFWEGKFEKYKFTFYEIGKMLGGKCHVEKIINHDAAIEYIRKEDSRYDGPFNMRIIIGGDLVVTNLGCFPSNTIVLERGHKYGHPNNLNILNELEGEVVG